MVGTHLILLLVIQTGLILGLSRVMGYIFVRVRQPQVMGEMIAGIMLGPSLFGWLTPGLFAQTFPSDSVQYLNALSQVGIIFFLFLVGLELDPQLLRNRGRSALVISQSSIITPMILGGILATILYHPLYGPHPTARLAAVCLFVGAAMSITAFPVLARILTERNMHRTRIGAVAITCAAVDDVTAWCLLAFVIAIARATGLDAGLWTLGKSVAYIIFMLWVVRPFLRRIEQVFESRNRLSQNLLAVIFLLVLGSALATEWIGIHALFGAFLMGAIMPKGTRFVRTLTEKLEDFTVVFLLPVFFAYTGLRTQIGLLNHPALWAYTGLIVVVACVGKFGGSAVAARICGFSGREASAIGILMNTRGLMELIILNIGRDLGVIPQTLFAMMVLMAIITTALTTPVLHWLHPQVESEAEELAQREARRGFAVLIPISRPASGGRLANMAALLAPAVETNRRIIALHLQRPSDRDPYARSLTDDAAGRSESLEPLLTEAKQREIPVEPIAFVSRDIPSDIARVARARRADLILMGFHKPIFGRAILGGTVHRVLTASDTDVAILVDRGLGQIKTVLAPYLGGKHDRLALELAGRIAYNGGAALTVLHVVRPRRSNEDSVLNARTVVERTFADPAVSGAFAFQVIEDPSPVEAVIGHARNFDLVVIGVEEQWGMESHLFGFRPERVARDTSTSLLIVRKYAGPTPINLEAEAAVAPG
jgi:Kef-type K+ transport system membrane component KefB